MARGIGPGIRRWRSIARDLARLGGRGTAVFDPTLILRRADCGRGNGSFPEALRNLRGTTLVLLSRGLGGGAYLHRDLRLQQPAGKVLRREPGNSVSTDQHSSGCKGRRRPAADLSAA